MKKIKIALIDSGVDVTHTFLLKNVQAFYDVTETTVKEANIFDDMNGHGTACTYIIDKNIEEAYDLYIYRVFQSDLSTTTAAITNALEHCLVNIPDIINMSLGTINDSEKLEQICLKLFNQGVVIVAAAGDDKNISIWPAEYPSVIKVSESKEKKKLYYDVKNQCLEIFAYSGARRAAWKNGKYTVVYGSSFACAYVTGILANYMNKKQIFDVHQVINEIDNIALKTKTDEKKQSKELFECKKVLLYPFNKEMHSIFRFRNLLSFEIEKIVDLPFLGNAQKDAGVVLGLDETGILIDSNFEKTIETDIDTVVLGDLSALTNIYKRNIALKYAELAFKKKKNVISIELLTKDIYNQIETLAKENNCEFMALNDFIPKEIDIEYDKGINVPVLLVLGTGPKVGKFTLQLTLKKCLEYIGYKVLNISTEPQGFLFDMKVFPLGNWNLLQYIPFEKHIDALKGLIISEVQRVQPEILLVGGQSGVVPYCKQTHVDYNCLSSIISLMATKADAIILCINPNDEIDYIKRTISSIESLGYGKVIMCFMSSLLIEIMEKKGVRVEKKQTYTGDSLLNKLNYYERRLNLPVLSIYRNEDVYKGIKLIQDYFS